jgi:hypothetical protein
LALKTWLVLGRMSFSDFLEHQGVSAGSDKVCPWKISAMWVQNYQKECALFRYAEYAQNGWNCKFSGTDVTKSWTRSWQGNEIGENASFAFWLFISVFDHKIHALLKEENYKRKVCFCIWTANNWKNEIINQSNLAIFEPTKVIKDFEKLIPMLDL